MDTKSTKDTMDTMPNIVESFVTFVTFVPRWCGGEDQGHDEAAQSVADRRRHPITLTKLRGQQAGRRAPFAICPKQGRKSDFPVIRCKDGARSLSNSPIYA